MKFFYFLFFICFISFAQQKSIEQIEREVLFNNDLLRYQKSIQALSDFISNEKTSDYDRYYAYLLKSYTYKRVFNYELVLYNLELALHEGLKSIKSNWWIKQ